MFENESVTYKDIRMQGYVEKFKRAKFDEKVIEGIFLEYYNRSKEYRLYYTGGNEVMIPRTEKMFRK